MRELILKNGNTIRGDEVFFHGDLTSLVKTRNKGFVHKEKVKDVYVVFSDDVIQMNYIGISEQELEGLLESLNSIETESEPIDEPCSEIDLKTKELQPEEFVLNTPLSEVMYN